MSDRQGVEIDYCPQCRGVWLDRGELDKIIERSGQTSVPSQVQIPAQPQPTAQSQPQYQQQYPQQQPYQQYPQQGYDGGYYIDKHGKRKHKKSILGEIFDF